MLQQIWIIQILVIISILIILFLICILTDLPFVLRLSFTKKETIGKYIEKKVVSSGKYEKTICTFRMIGSRYLGKIEKVFIFMCVCTYKKEKKKLVESNIQYIKGIVTLSRKFGVYKVLDIETSCDDFEEYFPKEIINSEDYIESTNNKEKRFLKEANLKKAKKKFKVKKAYKV